MRGKQGGLQGSESKQAERTGANRYLPLVPPSAIVTSCTTLWKSSKNYCKLTITWFTTAPCCDRRIRRQSCSYSSNIVYLCYEEVKGELSQDCRICCLKSRASSCWCCVVWRCASSALSFLFSRETWSTRSFHSAFWLSSTVISSSLSQICGSAQRQEMRCRK